MAAPGALLGALLRALLLDELLEVLQIALHARAVDAQHGANLLNEPFVFPVQLQADAGRAIAELVECDYAGLGDVSSGALPGNALVRVLFGDLGVELTLDPATTFTTQWLWVSSIWVIDTTKLRNFGNDSTVVVCMRW